MKKVGIRLMVVFAFACFLQGGHSAVPFTASGKEFVSYFLPQVRRVNLDILFQRAHLLNIRKKLEAGNGLYIHEIHFLSNMAQRYKLPSDTPNVDEFRKEIIERINLGLERCDIVPEKLVLAQAIVESGWGKSSAARKTNNFFGLTQRRANGLVVTQSETTTYYLKSYSTLYEGIKDYMRTINTFHSYKKFRQMRASMRKQGKKPDAELLAHGLIRWSERRELYTEKLRMVIRHYLPKDIEVRLLREPQYSALQ
ncbi:MAG: glucosaminidase domain-containing protein [Bacteroidetes bacterium]|nr:glucosaminidase domain-containing protein [Bacteroidota bacterium]